MSLLLYKPVLYDETLHSKVFWKEATETWNNSIFNQYSVIPVNKDKCPKVQDELAKKFSDWLVSDDTQKFIGDFKLLNKPLFIPNAK